MRQVNWALINDPKSTSRSTKNPFKFHTIKGEIIEKSLKVYFAANPHFLWKHFVFDDFGITRGISKWCKHNLLDLSIFV